MTKKSSKTTELTAMEKAKSLLDELKAMTPDSEYSIATVLVSTEVDRVSLVLQHERHALTSWSEPGPENTVMACAKGWGKLVTTLEGIIVGMRSSRRSDQQCESSEAGFSAESSGETKS